MREIVKNRESETGKYKERERLGKKEIRRERETGREIER